MKSFIYVLFDKVLCNVVRIFIFKNDNVCLRSLQQFLEAPNSPFLNNIKDMELYKVAVIDEETLELQKVVVEVDGREFPNHIRDFEKIVSDFLEQRRIENEKRNKESTDKAV